VAGFEFKAKACGVEALVVALVGELAQVEFTVACVLGFVLLQAEAALVGGVVKDELVVAACAVLAVVELLGFDTRQGGGVVVGGFAASEPAGGVGGGRGGGAGYLVVGGVVLALAVVQAGYDDGAVDVAIDEVYQNFLADSWQLDAAPVVACGGGEVGGDAYPGAAGGVAWGGGVVIQVRVAQAAVALVAALPVCL
jgi:hypothetical protein